MIDRLRRRVDAEGWRALAQPPPAALLAGLLALALYLLGPPGGDAAAHLYQTQLWRQEGWQLWDNLWYSGRYAQVNYSLLYYPLAALIGSATVITGAVALATGAFAAIVKGQWPAIATGPVIAFALVMPLGVVAGTYPFLLGAAFALLALATMLRGRLAAAWGLLALATLAHPLALLLGLVVLLGIGLSCGPWWREGRKRWFAAGAIALGAGQALAVRAFASDGSYYPFPPVAALAIAVFCGAGIWLTRGVAGQRALRAVFVAYGVAAAAAFIVSSPLGGNIERLILLMGTPLILLPLAARRFQPRSLTAGCVALVLAWQAFPAVAGWSTATDARAAEQGYWLPVIAFLERHHDPDFRVEVVATADNWEAYHLAGREVPIARGWFRQDDFPVNAVLYEPMTTGQYVAWMRQTGVRYVFLSDDPLDDSARHEAAVLRALEPGDPLRRVADIGGWSVFDLRDPTPIATPIGDAGGVEVVSLTSRAVTLRVEEPGRYRLRLSYTPYWRVERGEACVSPRQPWGTELRAQSAGVVRIGFGVELNTLVSTVLGEEGGCGPPVYGPFLPPDDLTAPGSRAAPPAPR